MALPQDTIRRRTQVVSREVSDGAVLVDMLDGRCFELNRMGGLFWAKLEGPASIDQICTALLPNVAASRETLERDLCGLTDDLLRAGLIELVGLSEPLAR